MLNVAVQRLQIPAETEEELEPAEDLNDERAKQSAKKKVPV